MIDLNEYLYVPLWLLLISGFTSGVIETVVGALIGVFTVGRRREKQWKQDIAATAEAGARLAKQLITPQIEELKTYVDKKLTSLEDQELTLGDNEIQRIKNEVMVVFDPETGARTPLSVYLDGLGKEIRATRMTFLSKKGVAARQELQDLAQDAMAGSNGQGVTMDAELAYLAKRLFHAKDEDLAVFVAAAQKRGYLLPQQQGALPQNMPYIPR